MIMQQSQFITRKVFIQGGAKNGAILSHCKYSENSMTALRRNIANIFLLSTYSLVCFDDVTMAVILFSVNFIEILLSFIHTVQIDLSIKKGVGCTHISSIKLWNL